MRRPRGWFALLVLSVAFTVEAAPKKKSTPPPPPAPLRLAHLAMPRVDVQLRNEAALVTVDLTFTRGQHRGPLEIFCAYGNPGIPRAFEAELLAVEPGYLLPSSRARGGALPASHAQQAPPEAALVIGPRGAAGQLVRVSEEALDRALNPSGLAALRLRWVHAFTAPHGAARSALVRATVEGRPLPLGTLNIHTEKGRVTEPSAARCVGGPETPLALLGERATGERKAPSLAPLAPGDLCFEGTLVQ